MFKVYKFSQIPHFKNEAMYKESHLRNLLLDIQLFNRIRPEEICFWLVELGGLCPGIKE